MSAAALEVDAALKRFENLYPRTIDLSLDRILAVLETLGRPQDALPPVIHVAGTNGKGSTTAFMRAMAEAAGLAVHAFTSPHLVRFNERVRLAGRLVDDEPLAEWLARTHRALHGRPITHFEATTAAALLAFAETPADVLLLEVGLGGRFDATNVIDRPAVSVITPVDFDHKKFLGNDLGRIAWEKAGVIKRGAPVVSAIQADIPAQVIAEEAASLGAPLTVLRRRDLEGLPQDLALKGRHQIQNAGLAALALKAWGHPAISEQAIRAGAADAFWPARMQRLKPGPVTALGDGAEVWLDGGHNPHAARAIAALLSDMGGETVLVSAMMAAKDANGFFAGFKPLNCQVFTCPNAPGHQAAEPPDLAAAAERAGLNAAATNSLDEAMRRAADLKPARILICGSLYLAGDVLSKNGEPPT
ncbi:MAG: folylpolyglutamate synthase/dihydrofolate synthase family protein [Pseudomonadota bacterium]